MFLEVDVLGMEEKMGDKFKILIIDDSALMRSVESDIIGKDNRFEVVDTAPDGVTGLDLLIRNNGQYDLVLLDVNMPKMNGLEVLTRIQKYKLRCKVIMVSTLVKEGAHETILALERGAVDFVLKPSAAKGESRDEFEKKLLVAIAAALGCDDGVSDNYNKIDSLKKQILAINNSNRNVLSRKSSSNNNDNVLVAIACSTGGPKTLKEIIPKLPKDIGVPIVLVQHMPMGFTKSLADRLDELSEIAVTEAVDGEKLEKGHVYIAPGGKQLRIAKGIGSSHVIKLTDEEPRDGLRPCANIMYESLAEMGYEKILCVVLTGMGADGRAGIEKLSKTKETYTIAQDAETCVVYGMPRAIVSSGLADEVLPLDSIAGSIIKNVGVLSDGR